ncbi:unnamed protein product [Miscanthus lutarioriparius]|uniref:Endoplasmic reticulum vesicle transporter N-terminal domain-containing protein n=1 Tax=Miscanthus lutarioriparius TaxID=422564 RepID=A0A811MR40_9POAL|nr:unnamed protein product [Miscanthus lutarioriparius]
MGVPTDDRQSCEDQLHPTHPWLVTADANDRVSVWDWEHRQFYLTTYTVHQMSVDLKRGETPPIHINMSFPSLPCEVLSVDAIDMSGKHEVDLHTNI